MTASDKRKCFTFAWTIENISYCWQKTGECVQSPEFVISAIEESTWLLQFYPRGLMDENEIDVFLRRRGSGSSTKIDSELACLSRDGSVLVSQRKEKCDDSCNGNLSERKKVFVSSKSVHQDKLTVRCRIWKSDGEMAEAAYCQARTRICIESYSFLWNIQNFNSQQSEKHNYQIKSPSNNEVLMNLDLSLHNREDNLLPTEEDSIDIQLAAENDMPKYFVLHLAPLNGSGKAKKDIRKDFTFHKSSKFQQLTLPFTKTELLANKSPSLVNNALSFRCECTFSTGTLFQEIERIIYGNHNCCQTLDSQFLDDESNSSASKRILNENLKSLLHDNILSDVTLKTSTASFLCHKNILSARSQVFKAMFSSNMQEKLTDCVNIEDLDGDTVSKMLHYIYTAEVEDLRLENACKLYGAADKYEIPALRDECSAYLKSNLCSTNACDLLIFADSYQDVHLKTSVEDFIFKHNIINSEEWKHFMETHLKLAADTMHLQIQRMSSSGPLEK